MLIIPVGQGILYVEPIYLQSKNNDIPTLARVVVSDGVTFVMEKDLNKALAELVARKRGVDAKQPLAASPADPVPALPDASP
jgi:uncharacterized membrane protein (UPF0182 family)